MQNMPLQFVATPVSKNGVPQEGNSHSSKASGEKEASFASVLKGQVKKQANAASANSESAKPVINKTKPAEPAQANKKEPSKENQVETPETEPLQEATDLAGFAPEITTNPKTALPEAGLSEEVMTDNAELQGDISTPMGLQMLINQWPPTVTQGVKDTTISQQDVALTSGFVASKAMPGANAIQIDRPGDNAQVTTAQGRFAEALSDKAASEDIAFKSAGPDMELKEMPLKEAIVKAVEGQASSRQATKTSSVLGNDKAVSMNQVNTAFSMTPAAQTAISTGTGVTHTIGVPFGHQGWQQAISQRVVLMLGSKDQAATLTLNPPDLGPVQVVLQVDNQHVDTMFLSDNPEVRQALQDSLSVLKDKLQDSGLQLGQTHIGSHSESRQQGQQTGTQQAGKGGAGSQESLDPALMNGLPQENSSTRVLQGLVNTFA